jgi:hypothetical protein
VAKILESLISAVLDRDEKASGNESSIVSMHCQQMREYGIRGGNIEFFPLQPDPDGKRKKLIADVWSHNRLSQSLNYVMDLFVCRGEILWFFLPDPDTPGNYFIDFFHGGLNDPKPEFKVFYKAGGREIEKAIIVYSYEIEDENRRPSKRWVRLRVDSEQIEMYESMSEINLNSQLIRNSQLFDSSPIASPYPPSLDLINRLGGTAGGPGTKIYPNPFKPFLPVVVCKNNPRRGGQAGTGDFAPVAGAIEAHELMSLDIRENLETFAGPSLVTTRSAKEVIETASKAAVATWASQNRYVDAYGDRFSGSTNPADAPAGQGRNHAGFTPLDAKEKRRIAKIIGNVADRERFGYIQPNPITGDMTNYATQYRENVHWTLGGLDPLGLRSGATFGEIRSLFGRIQNTAEQRANGLLTFGLAIVLERCIYHQEVLFKEWLFKELKQNNPDSFNDLISPDQLTDDITRDIYKIATSPPEEEKPRKGRPKQKQSPIILANDPEGFLPGGDRTCAWRYTREVYQLTTRERLDYSIAGRNEREDGLSQEWVLRRQYPDLTDEEIKSAMAGFSPRVVNNAAGAIATLLQLYQQLLQMPDPNNPQMPWAIGLGLDGMITEAMFTLQKELAYGRPGFKDADPSVNRYNVQDLLALIQNESSPANTSGANGTPIAPPAPGSSVSATPPNSDSGFSQPVQPGRNGVGV